MYLEHLKGDTWCIVTDFCRIPFYKLDEKNIVMMDTGMRDPMDGGILDLLKKSDLKVSHILTTHAHIDHVGNHAILQREHGAKVYMTLFDAAVTSSPLCLKTYMYGSSYKFICEHADSMLCKTDELILPDQKNIIIEGVSFEILNLPGHAPEHLAFVTPDGVAYVADLLMTEHVLRSVRIPHITCWEEDLKSKRYIRNTQYSAYIMAHNGVCNSIDSLIRENIEVIEEKIKVVEDLLCDYMTMDEIAARGIKKFGVKDDTGWKLNTAYVNIRTFLEYLLDSKRAISVAKDGVTMYIRV